MTALVTLPPRALARDPSRERHALSLIEGNAQRRQRSQDRARVAWLLAVDLAEEAVDGTFFLRIYTTPEKVGRGSDAKTAMARKIACYLACTVADCEAATLAKAAKLNRKTVHSHLSDVEDMRDRPGMDEQLDGLRDEMIRRAAELVMASLGGVAA